MKIAAHVLVGLLTLAFGIQTLQWLIDPAAAAEGLGMPLLEGIGASSQIGDISAFFLVGTVLMLLGQRRGQSHWLHPAAMMLGGAALMRTLAWAFGYAPFATQFIVTEIIMLLILLGAAKIFADDPSANVI